MKKNVVEKKEKKPARKFWQNYVSIWYEFYRDKVGESPTFDGSSPRDLGMIADAIQKKAEEKKLEWTEELAEKSIRMFFEYAWKIRWLQENFLLFNLNRQKDKIFFEIKKSSNEQTYQRNTSSTYNGKSAGAAQLIGILRENISTNRTRE